MSFSTINAKAETTECEATVEVAAAKKERCLVGATDFTNRREFLEKNALTNHSKKRGAILLRCFVDRWSGPNGN
jgi:hypothetical protein